MQIIKTPKTHITTKVVVKKDIPEVKFFRSKSLSAKNPEIFKHDWEAEGVLVDIVVGVCVNVDICASSSKQK